VSLAAADALTQEGNDLFQQQAYPAAAARFERAVTVYPTHAQAWKGLGHSLLCMGKAAEAARAFDRAIGLRPESATALWGGALAHADLGHKLVAQNYLRRALVLQPTWSEMALGVPQLAELLQLSAHAGDLIRRAFGTYSGRAYRHTDGVRRIEVARLVSCPEVGITTAVSIGVCDHAWATPQHPRMEIILASTIDTETVGQIVANAAFHIMDSGFYPEPGAMVRDLVAVLKAGELSQRLPHLYFNMPRLWRVRLPLDIGPPAITLSQAIPVSEAEYQYWKANGPAGLDAAFVARRVEIADLRRPGTL
jgi:tetratricopeptide (TPR) repeat protein